MKCKELPDARVVSITRIERGFSVHFLKRFESQYLMND